MAACQSQRSASVGIIIMMTLGTPERSYNKQARLHWQTFTTLKSRSEVPELYFLPASDIFSLFWQIFTRKRMPLAVRETACFCRINLPVDK